jgi:hypothetical protein
MDISKLKAAISRIKDDKVLAALQKHTGERRRALANAAWQGRCDEAWAVAKTWEIGQTIYSHMAGTSLGGDWQCGDSGVITTIQPRAKRVWIEKGGKSYWFEPAGLARHSFSLEPCAPMDPQARAWADKVGAALTQVID